MAAVPPLLLLILEPMMFGLILTCLPVRNLLPLALRVSSCMTSMLDKEQVSDPAT